MNGDVSVVHLAKAWNSTVKGCTDSLEVSQLVASSNKNKKVSQSNQVKTKAVPKVIDVNGLLTLNLVVLIFLCFLSPTTFLSLEL